jgi:uncharacterized protein YdaU (DUF1376 family)
VNGLPYYKAYPRDFIEGTIGMSFEDKGAYRLVLDLIYMQGGELPDDPRYISGLLGCTVRKWKAIRNRLISAGKLAVCGACLTNKRAIIELETLAKLQDKKRENRARPNKNKGLQSHPSHHTEPEPDKESKGPVGTPEKSTPKQTLDPTLKSQFDSLWDVYPDGQGLGCGSPMALIAFKRVVEAGANPGDVVEAARRYAADPTQTYPQRLDRWLTSGGWEAWKPKGPDWHKIMQAHREADFWREALGPKPGEPDCRVPAEVLREYGYDPKPRRTA